jgi:adenylate cyclase
MSDTTTIVTGGCLCGAVRYEAEVYLDEAYFCHCRMCQKSSGAPAEIAVLVKPGTLRFTGKEPKFYRSSPFAERGFCRDCGARIIYRPIAPEHAAYTNLAVGCLDHPEQVVPARHICVDTQQPWYKFQDGLPRVRSSEIPELVELWASAGRKGADAPLG